MHLAESLSKVKIIEINSFFSNAQHRNSEVYKNQYTYKLMVLTKGSATVDLCHRKYPVSTYDVLFLQPGERYRVLNTHGDFEVINLYFTFGEDAHHTYTYDSAFDRTFCTSRESFDGSSDGQSSFVGHSDCAPLLAAKALRDFGRGERGMHAARAFLSALLVDLTQTREKDSLLGEEIASYIAEHCEEKITAKALAERFHRHPVQINRIIKKQFGMTFIEYMMSKKTEVATVYLCETEMSITEIAMQLDFYDSAHFIKAFKKRYGITPSSYRRHRSL